MEEVYDEGDNITLYFKGNHLWYQTQNIECYFSKSDNVGILVYDTSSAIHKSLGHLLNRSSLNIERNSGIYLKIANLQKSDTGRYKCGIDSNYVFKNLIVVGKPILMINKSVITKKFVFPHNESVIITCQKDTPNDTKLKIMIDQRELSGKNDKDLSNIPDMNTILRTVSHVFTIDDADRTLTCCDDRKATKAIVTIDILVKPELSLNYVNYVKAGTEITFTCTSKSRPAVDMLWYKNGQLLWSIKNNSKLKEKIYFVTNTLIFIPVKEDNNKTLNCIVKNNIHIRKSVNLNVTYAPICDQSIRDYIVHPDTTFSLTCAVDGNPPANNFSWFKESEFIISAQQIHQIKGERNVSYFCVAGNTIGQSEPCKFQISISEAVVSKVIPIGPLLIALLVILVGISMLTGFVCWWRRKRKSICKTTSGLDKCKELKPPSFRHVSYYSGVKNIQFEDNREYYTIDDLIDVPMMEVKDMTLLGIGNFGIVYKGECIRENEENSQFEMVAVKILKDLPKSNGSITTINKFLSEIELHYRMVHHINVIICHGQTLLNGKTGMVLEYAGNGTVKSELQKDYHYGLMNVVLKEVQFIADLNLKCLKFSREVASGMVHISNLKIVHRDLAARNILIAFNGVCKISDFGLARCMQESMEYNMSSNDPVPVRWLSPESLLYNKYTEKSDVWAFGIFLWEIIALGGTPYPDIKSGIEVKNALQHGYRMIAPKHCSTELSEVMKVCWELEPDKRPTFATLENVLSKFLSDRREYIDFENFDKSIYENLNPELYRENIFQI